MGGRPDTGARRGRRIPPAGLAQLRTVAALDAANVVALAAASRRHGAAALIGYAPALVATALVHVDPRRRRLARMLCIGALAPNTAAAAVTAGPTARDRLLSVYLAVGGAVIGLGYLSALSR